MAALKQSYHRDVDDVRGLTFIMPNSMSLYRTDCYLYISNEDNSNSLPSLFFRCVHYGEEADHFDEMMFRVGNTTFTVKMQGLDTVKYGRMGGQRYVYYDFPVTRWYDNLHDRYYDNKKAIEALVSVEDEETVRFDASLYRTYSDITLTPDKMKELRLAYRMWQVMRKGKTDLSFLKSEDEIGAEHNAKMNAQNEAARARLQKVTEQ